MKAGKSSFLNACMFGGKELLPKAATPMTAALTKISYSETPKAVVHFYTREDWDRVVADSKNTTQSGMPLTGNTVKRIRSSK